MVSTVKATAFIKPMKTGRTCPCLMLCVDKDGNQVEVVVKLIAGKESSGTGLICELIASFLAMDLNLPVLQPFLVEVDADFYAGLFNPELSERFKNSSGLNFGSSFLGPGYSTWLIEKNIPDSLIQIAAEIFAFDFIIQNPDRLKHKPNLLRKGDELAIFDHELAFSFLHDILSNKYTWNDKGFDFIKNHIFYDGLKRKKVSLDRIQSAFEAVDERRVRMYMKDIPNSWRDNSHDTIQRIQEYLINVRNNNKNIFQKIREVLI